MLWSRKNYFQHRSNYPIIRNYENEANQLTEHDRHILCYSSGSLINVTFRFLWFLNAENELNRYFDAKKTYTKKRERERLIPDIQRLRGVYLV